jgi:ABC-type glutathione transport system ATPase component
LKRYIVKRYSAQDPAYRRSDELETKHSNQATSSTVEKTPLFVEMHGIVKRFPGVLANDHVDFDLLHGEIHALLGETVPGKVL